MQFGSRAGDAQERHSGNKCLGDQVRGSHRGMVERPEAGCEPEEKAWEIPGTSQCTEVDHGGSLGSGVEVATFWVPAIREDLSG